MGLVRQQIDAQADALRYLNRAYIADYGIRGAATDAWNKIVITHAVDKAQPFDAIADGTSCHLPTPAEQPFTLDVTKLSAPSPILTPTADVTTYARVVYDASGARAEGLWIQAVRSSTSVTSGGRERPGYYDFHIRACWQTPGQAAPVTLGTIVRLYEPRG